MESLTAFAAEVPNGKAPASKQYKANMPLDVAAYVVARVLSLLASCIYLVSPVVRLALRNEQIERQIEN